MSAEMALGFTSEEGTALYRELLSQALQGGWTMRIVRARDRGRLFERDSRRVSRFARRSSSSHVADPGRNLDVGDERDELAFATAEGAREDVDLEHLPDLC